MSLDRATRCFDIAASYCRLFFITTGVIDTPPVSCRNIERATPCCLLAAATIRLFAAFAYMSYFAMLRYAFRF